MKGPVRTSHESPSGSLERLKYSVCTAVGLYSMPFFCRDPGVIFVVTTLTLTLRLPRGA